MSIVKIIFLGAGIIIFLIGIFVLLAARKKYISSHQESLKFPLPKDINNKGNVLFFMGILVIVLSLLLK